jgi:hypothetical protein
VPIFFAGSALSMEVGGRVWGMRALSIARFPGGNNVWKLKFE